MIKFNSNLMKLAKAKSGTGSEGRPEGGFVGSEDTTIPLFTGGTESVFCI